MSRFKLFIVAVSFSLGLAMAGGSALAQETTESMTATDGDATVRGDGDASAAPGLVTRGGVGGPGTALLGPDGTYNVVDTAPSTVTIAGDTEALAPPAAPAAAPATTVAGCDSYASWYDAQVAYEAAGMTAGGSGDRVGARS